MTNVCRKLVAASLIAVTIVTGVSCGKARAERLHLVCVVDLSGSIPADAQAEAFAGLQVAFKRLRRGDSLTVIPVTGDAASEGQGTVIRLRLGEKRTPYDSDLRALEEESRKRLKQLQADAEAAPYGRSDILGAVAMAAEELDRSPAAARRCLFVLSDFIQHDRTRNFVTDPALKSGQAFSALGRELGSVKRATSLRGAEVYLGTLRSNDLRGLAEQHREAIEAFWVEYFRQAGGGAVTKVTDGPAGVANLMKDGE